MGSCGLITRGQIGLPSMGGYLNKSDHDQTTGELEPSSEANFEFGAEKSNTLFKML